MCKLLPVLLVITPLAACQHSSIKDENSVFYSVPVGSTLVLNTKIHISPNQVSVLMQNGVIKKHADIDFYSPNCKFELYSISEESRVVAPDHFLITRVVDDNEFTGVEAQYYASLSMMASDTPLVITYATEMYLESRNQPNVYRMTCKHWESVIDDNYLSISEMRKAMGDLLTLKIAQ
jgi:hypothetical protein